MLEKFGANVLKKKVEATGKGFKPITYMVVSSA